LEQANLAMNILKKTLGSEMIKMKLLEMERVKEVWNK
jgi:hypothetical protein